MKKYKKTLFFICIFLLFFIIKPVIKVYAAEEESFISLDYFMDESDLEEMQQILDENLVGVDFQIDNFIRKIWKGEIELSGENIIKEIQKNIEQELENNRKLWLQCFLIVVN